MASHLLTDHSFVEVYYGLQTLAQYEILVALTITSKPNHHKEQDKATNFLEQLGIIHAKVEEPFRKHNQSTRLCRANFAFHIIFKLMIKFGYILIG